MGVASFFRWVVARYPKALQPAVEEEPITDQTEPECRNYLEDNQFLHIDCTLPNPNGEEFANLYLDLNGVVHMCTHPEDRPPPATEDDMFQDIFRYIDRIVALVRPRRLIYLAIDGVAPRAKINQQRSRRFRAAKEAREKEEEEVKLRALWQEQGLRVPPKPKKPFDSNVITPGTPFMERLAAALGAYVRERLRSCAAWRSLVVILSDASVPGEGEHKIAEFIRTQRAQPGYDKQTSHILYGLDADLIMLALATHEPHFFILRERVYFDYRADKAMHAVKNMNEQHHGQHEGTNKGAGTMEAKAADRLSSASLRPFDFFRIDRLREYLDSEFRDALTNGSSKMPEDPLDMERVIDDFVFLCFFVGNDFLPHLPSLEIREGAIDFLLEVYKSNFARVGYLTDGRGGIHFDRVREILREVARVEDYVFRERARMARSFASQTTALPVRASETQHGSIQTANEDLKKPGNPTLTTPNDDRRQTNGTESRETGKHLVSSPLTLPGTAERASKLSTTEQDPGLGLVPLPRKHVKENRAISMRSWRRPENERSKATVMAGAPSDAAASASGSTSSREIEQDMSSGVTASPKAISVQAAAAGASEWQSEPTASESATKMQGESRNDLRRKRRRILDDDAESDSGQMPATDVTESGAQSVANDLVGQSSLLADPVSTSEAKCTSYSDSREDQSRGLVGNVTQAHGPAEPEGIASLESHESVQDVIAADDEHTLSESEDSDDVLEEVLDHYIDEEGRHFEQVLRERLKLRQAQPDTGADSLYLHLPGWKERYYGSKFPDWPALGTDAGSRELKRLCHAYCEGLLWVFRYYYSGCPSWGWFYPYHYAPFASDLAEYAFDQADAVFERGTPFTPLEQLMAVLPASSGAQCLPTGLYKLMVDKRSPIIDYYPTDFAVDLNGKKFAWQGVVLLPFVDEQRLRAAMRTVLQDAQEIERERDPQKQQMLRRADPEKAFGSVILFVHRDSELGRRLRQAFADVKSASIGFKLDGRLSNGVFGRVLRLEETRAPGKDSGSPTSGCDVVECTGIEDAVIYGVWTNAKHMPHVPQLLPGMKRPPPSLTDADLHALLAGRAGWKCARFGLLGQAAETIRRRRLAEKTKAVSSASAIMDSAGVSISPWTGPQTNWSGPSSTWSSWTWGNAGATGVLASNADGSAPYPTHWWPNPVSVAGAGAAAASGQGFSHPPHHGESNLMQHYQPAAYHTTTAAAPAASGYPMSQEAILAAYYGYAGPWTSSTSWAPATGVTAPSTAPGNGFDYRAEFSYSSWGPGQSAWGIQGQTQTTYPPTWSQAAPADDPAKRRNRPRAQRHDQNRGDLSNSQPR